MKRVLILIGFFAALSCQKDQLISNSCQVRNPLRELSWLKDTIGIYNSYVGDVTVRQALYQGQTVFSIDYFLGPDAGNEALYRCDGSIICRTATTVGGPVGNCGNIPNQLTDQAIIYERKR